MVSLFCSNFIESFLWYITENKMNHYNMLKKKTKMIIDIMKFVSLIHAIKTESWLRKY